MPMTTASPERPSSLTDPSSTNQESAPKHSPYVEVPPGRPPIDRHGQMASQLQDSKYEPRTSQSPKSIITASCRVAEAGATTRRLATYRYLLLQGGGRRFEPCSAHRA